MYESTPGGDSSGESRGHEPCGRHALDLHAAKSALGLRDAWKGRSEVPNLQSHRHPTAARHSACNPELMSTTLRPTRLKLQFSLVLSDGSQTFAPSHTTFQDRTLHAWHRHRPPPLARDSSHEHGRLGTTELCDAQLHLADS